MFKNVLNTIKKHSVAVKLYCVAFTLIFTLTVVLGFVANVIPEGGKIQIVRNSLTVTVDGDCETVADALELAGIKLTKNEYLNCSLSDSADEVGVIVISRKSAGEGENAVHSSALAGKTQEERPEKWNRKERPQKSITFIIESRFAL